MRRTIVPVFIVILIFLSACNSGRRKDTISISGAWALYPMAVRWAEEYKKLHPEVRIDISAGGAGKGIADVLGGLVEIGMVSRGINNEELKRGAFPVAVAKDAVVAVMNKNNPLTDILLMRGLSKDKCVNIWITGIYKDWGDLSGTDSDYPLHVFTRSDACGAAEIWAMYLGKNQEDLLGIAVYGDPGLAQAVKLDSMGIGFNNIGYVYDSETRHPVPGLIVVPIDLDNNGNIDENERFYSSMDEMIAAIASGNYPSPPSRELYFVLKGKPGNNIVLKDFLTWVLTSGQDYVQDSGYVPISQIHTASELQKIQ